MSNKEQIEASLKRLIDGNREFVAMLSGEWGIGKTYFWKEFATKYLEEKDKDVVYISLFGKHSLVDIETEIVIKLYKYNSWIKKYKDKINLMGNWISKVAGSSMTISAGSVLSLFSSSDFKNIIICFDDFERLSDKVPLKDVMGLISQFKEQKECKVIMILNEKELDKLSDIDGKKHDEIFALYKEKVVDYNFHYIPSQEELFEVIKEDMEKIKWSEHQTIYNFFRKIDLQNIRIMKQALYQLGQFKFIKDCNLDEKVVNEFVEIALNLFVFKAKSNYTYSEFKDLKEYIPYDMQKYLVKNNNSTDINKNAKHEKNLLYYLDNKDFEKKYQLDNKDIIEERIYDFIETHQLDEENIKKILEKSNENLKYSSVRDKIDNENYKFATDFKTPFKKVGDDLFRLLVDNKHILPIVYEYEDHHYRNGYKYFIERIKKYSPASIDDPSIKKLIETSIRYYVDEFNSEQLNEIEKDYDWANKYKDDYIKESIVHNAEDTISLIEHILNNEGRHCSDENFYKLNTVTREEYAKLIEENPSFISTLIKFCARSIGGVDVSSVKNKICQALNILQKESDQYETIAKGIAEHAKLDLEDCR